MIQFLFVIFKKGTKDTALYIGSEILFKVSIGLFLMLFFFVNKFPELHHVDQLIISFGGSLLIYDAVFNDLPKLIEMYNIYIPYINPE